MKIINYLFKSIYAFNFLEMLCFAFTIAFLYLFLRKMCAKKHFKIWKILNCIFIILYVFLVLYKAIITREFNSANRELILVPFSSYYKYFLGEYNEAFYTNRANILLFLPFGFLLYDLFNWKKCGLVCIICFIFSFTIELLQFTFSLGVAEADDLLHNTFGAFCGIAICHALRKIYFKLHQIQEVDNMQKTFDSNQKNLLNLCSKYLFNKDVFLPENFDAKQVLAEAKRQTVFPMVYSLIKDSCDDIYANRYSQIIAKNIRVEYAHNEVHDALSNNIPYVILKGVASASYYKEPMLRMMGDVDVLVSPENIAEADKQLKLIGFITVDDINADDIHVAYKRKDGISCELHRRIGWAPNNNVGDLVNNYLSDILEKSVEHKTANGCCIIPNNFHHGLVLLLHTATHLTHEGIGLRHLCDWAVFVNSFTNDEFIELFQIPLKEMGLWRFAQLLTLCCVKHLGCDSKDWAGEADNDLIDSIVYDILNGGNFGFKDFGRYNQIKYISDRENGTTSKRDPIFQVFYSINAKTKKNYKFANKFIFLVPIGWLLTFLKYIFMLITGKRKLDTLSTVINAKERIDIYNEFNLFNQE